MKHHENDVKTRLRSLQGATNAPNRIVPLAGDASTRRYFRAFYPGGRTAVIMLTQHPSQNEEASFLDVQLFLEKLNLPVPRVLFHDGAQGLLVLEDLGDNLLEQVVAGSNDDEIAPLYRSAVDLLLEIRRATDGLTGGCVAFSLAFDMAKLREEMHFFMSHFVKGLCRRNPSQTDEAALEQFFRRICSLLAAEPRVFTHRDYHSRNLILRDRRLVMIDFQDARLGPAQYDLASLLRDSYVNLPETLVQELIHRYADGVQITDQAPFERFCYVFDVMSLQRNIKALGTFGYQLSAEGNKRYASAIPRTGRYVARNIGLHEEFAEFRSVVEDYICGPAMAMNAVSSLSRW